MTQFPCLMYHDLSGCGRGEAADSQYTVPLGSFREHVALLKSEGVVVEDFGGLQHRIHQRSAPPARYAVLSFDDGHRSNLAAAEALSALGYRATFFLVTGVCDRGDGGFLTKQDIQQIVRAGHSVGAHGVTHTPLTALPARELVEELSASKNWLEDVTGKPVDFMSAPQGYLSKRVLGECFRQGYRLVGNSVEWPNRWPLPGIPGTINRVCIRRKFGLATVARIAAGAKGFYLRRRFRECGLAIPKAVLDERWIGCLSR